MPRYINYRLLILFVIFLTPLIMGMGTSGGTPGKIPIPAKKFTAVMIDQADVVTEVNDVSIEGVTFLEGKKGEGTFTVGFENVNYMNFLMKEGKLQCLITLRDGNTLQFFVNKNHQAYGRTNYGTFQISLNDLKKMIIKTAK